VGEGLVGVGHAVGVELFLDGVAGLLVSINQFGDELLGKSVIRTVATSAGGVDNPAESEGLLPITPDRHRDLIAGATDTTRANLHLRFDVFEGFGKISDFVGLGFLLQKSQGIINLFGGDGFLAIGHDGVDELGDHLTVVFDVGSDGSGVDFVGSHRLFGGFGHTGAVLAAATNSLLDASAVELAPNNMVFDTGKVTNAAAADHDDAVFGQIVSLAHDIGGDFLFVTQTNTGDFAQSRVWLLRGHGLDLKANTDFLGVGVGGHVTFDRVKTLAQSRSFDLSGQLFSTFFD